MTKRIMLVAAVYLAAATNILAQVSTTVQITNPATIARVDERVVLTQQEIAKQLGSTPQFISITHNGEQLPVQHIDNDLDRRWDEVVFLYFGWERTDKRFTTFQLYKDFLQEEAVKYSKPLQIKWKRG